MSITNKTIDMSFTVNNKDLNKLIKTAIVIWRGKFFCHQPIKRRYSKDRTKKNVGQLSEATFVRDKHRVQRKIGIR